MTIDDLITLLANQVATLNNARTTAQALGEVDQVLAIDAQVLETQATLDALRVIGG